MRRRCTCSILNLVLVVGMVTMLGCSSKDGALCDSCGTLPDAGSTPDVLAPNEMATGGATGNCPADPDAPTTTWSTPRRTMPWTFVAAGADAGTVAPRDDAGADCSTTSSGTTCSGQATVAMTSAGPELVFAGFGVVRWDLTGMSVAVAPPPVADGNSVWVAFSDQWLPVCPVCGSYSSRSIEIRDRQGGQILWIAFEGQKLGDVSATTQTELFGVIATVQLACSASLEGECHAFQRQVFDHVLQTTPPVLIHHGTVEKLSTPMGSYQVFWSYSQEQDSARTCLDGPDLASDSGFAASRVVP